MWKFLETLESLIKSYTKHPNIKLDDLDNQVEKSAESLEQLRTLTDKLAEWESKEVAYLARLRLEHSQLIAIFDSIDQPIHVVDIPTRRILYVNRAFEYEVGNVDVIGKHCYEIVDHTSTTCEGCIFSEIYDGEMKLGEVRSGEIYRKLYNRWFHRIEKVILWPNETESHKVVFVLSIDITTRKQVEFALQQHLTTQALVTEISTRFLDSTQFSLKKDVAYVLRRLGETLQVDHVYIFQYSRDYKFMSNTYEWVAAGITPQIDNLFQIPIASLPWYEQQLRIKHNVVIPSVTLLPEEAAAEKDHFLTRQIQSLMTVAAISGGQIKGFIGCDTVRQKRAWTDKEIELLGVVGEICYNVIARTELIEGYMSIVDYSIQGIAIARSDMSLVFVNQALANILELSIDDLLRMTYEDFQEMLLPEERKGLFQRFRDRVAGKEVPSRYTFRVKRPNGIIIWLEMFARLIKYNGSTAVQMTIVDVTRGKVAEEELKRSERLFREFFEDIPLYCYMLDINGIIMHINKAALSILGYVIEELIGKHVSIIYPADVRPTVLGTFEVWKQTGRIINKPLEIITKDGTRRKVLLNAGVERSASGEALHTLTAQVDITDIPLIGI